MDRLFESNVSVSAPAMPSPGAAALQTVLDRAVPVNELTGAEGLSVQGGVLIGLLALIGTAAWRGLGRVDAGFNRLTPIALGLTALTLVFAAVGIHIGSAGLAITLTGRTLAVAALCALLVPLAQRFDAWDRQMWLWETWRFVRQIFPLLVVGVFVVGVIRTFIEPDWIQFVAGSNTLLRLNAVAGEPMPRLEDESLRASTPVDLDAVADDTMDPLMEDAS